MNSANIVIFYKLPKNGYEIQRFRKCHLRRPDEALYKSLWRKHTEGQNIVPVQLANICFATGLPIKSVYNINTEYQRILKLFDWMDIDSHGLLYGINHINNACKMIIDL